MRIVTELVVDGSVSEIAKALEAAGVKVLVLPDDAEKTHLIVEAPALAKARTKLRQLRVKASEKEVILLQLENKPGVIAEAAGKVSDNGINLTYAFSAAMTPTMSYVVLGTADNRKAIAALSS